MKLAIQETLVPGDSFAEKVNAIKQQGFEGIELQGDDLRERVDEIKTVLHNTNMSATCIFGGYKFGLLFPDPRDRQQSRDEIKQLLKIAADIQAEGVIIVPIFHGPFLPDLSPWKTTLEVEEHLLIEQLTDLSNFAGQQGTKLFIEPLNRYETHYIQTLKQAAGICAKVNSSSLLLLADLFHMNIEETNMAKSINNHQQWLGYVHLADSNRKLPGHGHLDFQTPISALQTIGYEGWLSMECAVPDNDPDAIKQSLDFINTTLQEGWI